MYRIECYDYRVNDILGGGDSTQSYFCRRGTQDRENTLHKVLWLLIALRLVLEPTDFDVDSVVPWAVSADLGDTEIRNSDKRTFED